MYCEARFSYNAHARRRTRDPGRVNCHGEANAWTTCVARSAGRVFATVDRFLCHDFRSLLLVKLIVPFLFEIIDFRHSPKSVTPPPTIRGSEMDSRSGKCAAR